MSLDVVSSRIYFYTMHTTKLDFDWANKSAPITLFKYVSGRQHCFTNSTSCYYYWVIPLWCSSCVCEWLVFILTYLLDPSTTNNTDKPALSENSNDRLTIKSTHFYFIFLITFPTMTGRTTHWFFDIDQVENDAIFDANSKMPLIVTSMYTFGGVAQFCNIKKTKYSISSNMSIYDKHALINIHTSTMQTYIRTYLQLVCNSACATQVIEGFGLQKNDQLSRFWGTWTK